MPDEGLRGTGRNGAHQTIGGSLPDRAAALSLLRSLSTEPANLARIRALLASLNGHLDVGRLDNETVLGQIAAAAASGRIRIDGIPLRPAPVSAISRTEEAPEEQETRQESVSSTTATSWVEFELRDEDGEPVAGQRYRATLPNGTEKKGQLDRNGLARIVGISPGTAKIVFPDLDRDAWRRA